MKRTGDVIAILQEIVDKKVKHYKTDFNYDKETLKTPGHYIWIARECGTNLAEYEEIGTPHEYFREDSNVDYYDVVIGPDGQGHTGLIPFQKREKINQYRLILSSYNRFHQKEVLHREILWARSEEVVRKLVAKSKFKDVPELMI